MDSYNFNSRSDFIWGMNTHNREYQAYPEKNLEEHIKLCKNLGTNMVRFNFNPKSSDDYKYLDKVVELCIQKDLEIMLVLDGIKSEENGKGFENYHSEIASRYKGKIKYYQIFNETDVYCMHTDQGGLYNPGDGKVLDEYNPERLEEMLDKLKGSIRGFRKVDPDAKLVVNFGWWHTAIVDYYIENGASWDIIGWDWYSDMESKSSIIQLFDYLIKKHPSYNLMICECNIWAHDKYTEQQQTDYVIEFMNTIYNYKSDKVLGLVFYELLDELAFEHKKGEYEGESHFGFYYCDLEGTIGKPKHVYNKVKEFLN